MNTNVSLTDELANFVKAIDAGLADVAAGRVKDFDADKIIARGTKLLADRSPFVLPKRR
jgi:antitoxin ParD1/3/4